MFRFSRSLLATNLSLLPCLLQLPVALRVDLVLPPSQHVLRRDPRRRIAPHSSEGRAPVLKKSRWLLLKRKENLRTEQHFRLRDLLRYNLKTVRAYLLKEAFQQLWDYNSPAWAGKFLDEWCRQTMRSRIEPMKKIARSLRNHRELILNYFRAQKLLSSGVVEGLNNKAKVTMRKSYGFRTYRCLELALYHSLGKLPEPESTHDFFASSGEFVGDGERQRAVLVRNCRSLRQVESNDLC